MVTKNTYTKRKAISDLKYCTAWTRNIDTCNADNETYNNDVSYDDVSDDNDDDDDDDDDDKILMVTIMMSMMMINLKNFNFTEKYG